MSSQSIFPVLGGGSPIAFNFTHSSGGFFIEAHTLFTLRIQQVELHVPKRTGFSAVGGLCFFVRTSERFPSIAETAHKSTPLQHGGGSSKRANTLGLIQILG